MVELKTSFIPRRPIIASQEKKGAGLPANIFSTISLVLFFALLTIGAGLYFYKVALEQSIETMSSSLARAREAIDPALVASLKRLDERILVTHGLLENHTVISPIFSLLEKVSLQSIAFEQFSYSAEKEGDPRITLTGKGRDYASLALQSDAFGGDVNIKEPMFSNLRLDNEGKVLFSFSASINKNLLRWRENVKQAPSSVSTPPTPRAKSFLAPKGGVKQTPAGISIPGGL